MSYVLRVLTRARQDVDHIYNWLYARSPGGAARWYAAFLDACDKIVVEPERFGHTLESDEVGREIRAFYFKTRRGRRYLGLFLVEGNEVHVLRVRGPGQQPVREEGLS